MRRVLLVLSIFIMMLAMIAGTAASPASAQDRDRGNSEAAHACKQGGSAMQAPVSSPNMAFASQGECVKHGAQGSEAVPLDSDLDTVPDKRDACPGNDDQSNLDGDPYPDACDEDDDNDSFTDQQEVELGTDPRNAGSVPDARCLDGGYLNYIRTDGTSFDSVAACTSYVAAGGEFGSETSPTNRTETVLISTETYTDQDSVPQEIPCGDVTLTWGYYEYTLVTTTIEYTVETWRTTTYVGDTDEVLETSTYEVVVNEEVIDTDYWVATPCRQVAHSEF